MTIRLAITGRIATKDDTVTEARAAARVDALLQEALAPLPSGVTTDNNLNAVSDIPRASTIGRLCLRQQDPYPTRPAQRVAGVPRHHRPSS
jgi:hypothetical protein